MIESIGNFNIVRQNPEMASKKAIRKAKRAANFEFRKQNTISGYIAGVPDTVISAVALFGLKKPATNMMQKLSSNLTPEENKTVINSFEKAFKESSLPKMGTEIIRVGKDSGELTFNPIKSITNKIKNPKLKSFAEKNFENLTKVRNGDKAFFSTLENKIILPESKLSLTSFHEMGRALNCNESKIWSTVQCLRWPVKLLAPAVASAALFMNKKEETPDHKLTMRDKAINGFRAAAPYMVAAACLPEIAEEIIASIKGHKIAKSVLPKELTKKVVKSNAINAGTYIVSAAALALGTAIGVKVKDKVMAKRMERVENAQTDATQKQRIRDCKNNKL